MLVEHFRNLNDAEQAAVLPEHINDAKAGLVAQNEKPVSLYLVGKRQNRVLACSLFRWFRWVGYSFLLRVVFGTGKIGNNLVDFRLVVAGRRSLSFCGLQSLHGLVPEGSHGTFAPGEEDTATAFVGEKGTSGTTAVLDVFNHQ